MRTDLDTLATFRAHGTGPVSDALDLAGINGGLVELARVSGAGTVVGPAFTVSFEPVEPGTNAPAADFIDDVPEGAVVVIANGGRVDCTVWGDILAGVAVSRGVAGTVIDGACRDVDDIRALGYSLWSRGCFMKSGKNRARFVAAQVPINVSGALVHPGDLVCADGAGALVVPVATAERAAEDVLRIAEMEAAVRADLDQCVPLRTARARRGYNLAGLRR
ncbi:Demethylmenaquinone methyltransferase [Alloactinosynnema sp. L-07]|uniref:RraA family protein n=1 Tax=Alloactinosynnema sp. L-07 TaxID=1653480 RepID=UPI00065F0292|nr:RraA family protein [Alloactinosynnema sp. L-07]CRK57284.1 Demethylmenaquinone methyltransferase [Alloactinosynnema sp. L-07]